MNGLVQALGEPSRVVTGKGVGLAARAHARLRDAALLVGGVGRRLGPGTGSAAEEAAAPRGDRAVGAVHGRPRIVVARALRRGIGLPDLGEQVDLLENGAVETVDRGGGVGVELLELGVLGDVQARGLRPHGIPEGTSRTVTEDIRRNATPEYAPARLHLSPRGLAGYAVAPSTLSTSTSMSRTKMCCGQAVSQRPHLTQSAGPGWRRTIWR